MAEDNRLEGIIESAPKNATIVDNLVKAYSVINDSKYHNVICSLSGERFRYNVGYL